MIKQNTLVEVVWVDAYMQNDDEHVDATTRFPAAIERSVGYVVRDDRDAAKEPNIVLAMSKHDEKASGGAAVERHVYRDRMVIPAAMVRKVRRLT